MPWRARPCWWPKKPRRTAASMCSTRWWTPCMSAKPAPRARTTKRWRAKSSASRGFPSPSKRSIATSCFCPRGNTPRCPCPTGFSPWMRKEFSRCAAWNAAATTGCAPIPSGKAGGVTTAKNIRPCCARRLSCFLSRCAAALFRRSCQQRLQRFAQAGQSERLAEDGNAFEACGVFFRRVGEVAGHQKEAARELWAMLPQPAQHFHAVASGHFQVAQNDVERLGIELCFELRRIVQGGAFPPHRPEEFSHHVGEGRLVVNHQRAQALWEGRTLGSLELPRRRRRRCFRRGGERKREAEWRALA